MFHQEVFMKYVFLSALIFSFTGAAMLKKASINGALSHRYDENYEETNRGLASDIEKAGNSEKVKESAKVKKSKEQDYKNPGHKAGSRNPSAEGRSFEQANENGIRYWKY